MSQRRSRGGRDRCARSAEEDGPDRVSGREDRRRAASGFRDAQLAKIVGRAAENALCSMGPSILAGLHVVHVEVLAGGAHVRVYAAPGRAVRDRAALTPWLDSAARTLRYELARSLARKRVPTISLILADPPAGLSEGDLS